MLSIEYPLSDKMAAAFMADWLLATSRIAVKQNGPSLRLGLLFTH